MADAVAKFSITDYLSRSSRAQVIGALLRKTGSFREDLAEDAFQEACLKAIELWPHEKPDNPQAWLYRVAYRKLIDDLRKDAKYEFNTDAIQDTTEPNAQDIDKLIHDATLEAIFACATPWLNQESQITMALKVLFGFNNEEIANALYTNADTVTRRISRAKEKLRSENFSLEIHNPLVLETRLPQVLHVIYLLFNEGYYSTRPEQYIREDLCLESLRLGHLLSEYPATNTTTLQALMALMCFQASRLRSRVSETGVWILLPYQNKSLWNIQLIREGMNHLANSARGSVVSSYHYEAAIASYYHSAASYESIDWKTMSTLYNQLLQINNSPATQLNAAIVKGYAFGPSEGILALQALPEKLQNQFYYSAVGDCYLKMGDEAAAKTCFQKALSLTRHKPEQELLTSKLTWSHIAPPKW